MKTPEDDEAHSTESYHSMNEFKADFGSIYNQPDPRAYFSTLSQFEYIIPEMARPVLHAILNRLRMERGHAQVHVVDLGCSYGINAALLTRGMSIYELYAHYARPELAAADPATLAKEDEEYFSRHPASDALRITGLDVAENAVAYAERTGLVHRGAAADLESAPPTPEVTRLLSRTDAIISTGCVGYVTRTTFDHILSVHAGEQPPWVASFVLRMFAYDDIAETLATHGLVTEKLDGVLFPQRRFASFEEEANTLATLRDLDIDTAGLEDRHGFLAEFYLSRPQAEAEVLPLADLVPLNIIPERAISHRA